MINRQEVMDFSREFGLAAQVIEKDYTFVVECSYCDKKFRRKTNSTDLKAHKDKDGYPCSGRRGYLIDTIY